MLQNLFALVSRATMLADAGKVYGQIDDGNPSAYTYTNDAGGFSDGRSECNYDDNGRFDCKLVQSAPAAFPAWQGTPDTWSAS